MVTSPTHSHSAVSPTSLREVASTDGKSVFSVDGKSVFTFSSASALESVVGQDDPTVPASNVRREHPEIPDCETINSFVTQQASMLGDESQATEERDSGNVTSKEESSQPRDLRDQLNELDKAEKDWQEKMSQQSPSNLSMQLAPTESATEMQASYVDETGRTLELEAKQRQLQLLETVVREDDPEERQDKLPLTQSMDMTVSADASDVESTTAISTTALAQQPLILKSTSSETATDEIVRQVQKRLYQSDGNIDVPKESKGDDEWNLRLDDMETGNFEESNTPKSSKDAGKSLWKLNLDDVSNDEMGVDGTINSSDEEIDAEDSPKGMSRTLKCCLVILCLVMIIVGIVLVFTLGTDTDSSNTASPVSSSTTAPVNNPALSPSKGNTKPSATPVRPTVAPTAATASPTRATSPPTSQPTYDSRAFQHLYSISGDFLLDESTSQFKAYQWLANDDPAKLDINNMSFLALEQRYVGALLYFALDGDNWVSDLNFLSKSDVCEWRGIECNFSSHIIDITINENNLSGSLPFELKVLKYLQVLQLRQNKINGSVPSEFGKLSLIEEIDLRRNELEGTVPETVFRLPSLKKMYFLRNPKLTGSIPSSIKFASNLEMISFHQCQMTGTVPETIGELSNLYFITLMENNFSGSVPRGLRDLSKLEVLELSDNMFTGQIPSFSSTLQPNLYFVSLFGNKLTGTIPESFGSLKEILFLDIHDNQIKGTIPSSMGKLKKLVTFFASNNKLTGPLPSFAENSGTLQVLDVSHNMLISRLDEFFTEDGPAKRLVLVNFASNQLSGTIPPSLSAYTALTDFVMDSNNISGSLPSEIGDIGNIEHFRIGYNKLTGTIPSHVGKLTNLVTLNLESNEMFGTIPSSLNSLQSLEELRLNGNSFTGNLDSIFCEEGSPEFTIFAAECLGPSSDVVCSCCTSCCQATVGCKDV